jgi:hypothetical protein
MNGARPRFAAATLLSGLALHGCVDSAAQEKCSDGRTTLYLDGERAVMSSDSVVVAGPCISVQPLPVAPPPR